MKINIRLLLFVLGFILSTPMLNGQCSKNNKNGLTNPSFRQSHSGWKVAGEGVAVKVVDEGTADEDGYLVINQASSSILQEIHVPTKATSACLGGMVKNTESKPKAGWACVDWQLLDASGQVLKSDRLPHIKPGTTWQKLRKVVGLSPKVAKIRIILKIKDRPGTEISNEARFDDLFVRFDS